MSYLRSIIQFKVIYLIFISLRLPSTEKVYIGTDYVSCEFDLVIANSRNPTTIVMTLASCVIIQRFRTIINFKSKNLKRCCITWTPHGQRTHIYGQLLELSVVVMSSWTSAHDLGVSTRTLAVTRSYHEAVKRALVHGI